MSARRCLDLGPCGLVPVDSLHQLYLETVGGQTLTVSQTKSARSLGSWVYDGATTLAKYMESQHCASASADNGNLAGKRVLELGAGTGAVGVLACYYGADVTITDMTSLIPLIQYNIDQNAAFFKGSATAKPLCWGDGTEGFQTNPDYLVLANCVYYESSLEPLAETARELSGANTVVLASYEVRTREIVSLIKRWHSLMAKHFVIQDVPKADYKDFYQDDFVRIVRMKRRQ